MQPSRQIWRGTDHRGNSWLVEHYSEKLPNLVRWLKYSGGQRGHKLLDQVSEWRGSEWNATRWVPNQPIVPADIRQMVERQLQGTPEVFP